MKCAFKHRLNAIQRVPRVIVMATGAEGGAYNEFGKRYRDLLAREGRLCFVALMQGSRVEADFGQIQRKHLTVTGSMLRSRPVAEKAAIIAALRDKVWPLWAVGKLRGFTYKQFPLVEAAEAHRLMESSRHIGKILLVP